MENNKGHSFHDFERGDKYKEKIRKSRNHGETVIHVPCSIILEVYRTISFNERDKPVWGNVIFGIFQTQSLKRKGKGKRGQSETILRTNRIRNDHDAPLYK